MTRASSVVEQLVQGAVGHEVRSVRVGGQQRCAESCLSKVVVQFFVGALHATPGCSSQLVRRSAWCR